MRRSSILSVGLVVLVTSLLAVEARAASVADALPPQVFVYIDIPSVPALQSTDVNSAYGQIMAQPQVQTFLEKGFPALSTVDQTISAMTGKTWPQVLDLCKGEVAMALVQGAGTATEPQASFVLVADVGKDQTTVKDFVTQASGRISANWQQQEIPGTTAYSTQLGTSAIAYAFVGEHLVIASTLDTLKAVAGGLQAGLPASLANDPTYVKSLALAHAEQPEMVIYANVSLFSKAVLPHLGERGTRAYNESGLNDVASVIYSSRPVGKGYVDKIALYCPSGRKGVFAALSSTEGDYKKYLSMIPADVMSAAWTHMDFASIYDTVKGIVDTATAGEEELQREDPLAKLEADTGINLRQDIVGSLGKNVITYSPRPSAILGLALGGGIGQSVTLVELTDPARLEKSLDKTWNYAVAQQNAAEAEIGSSEPSAESSAPAARQRAASPEERRVTFTTEPFGDKTIYEMRISLGPKVPLQLSPAMAVRDGWLIFSMQAQNVKNMLGSPLIAAMPAVSSTAPGAACPTPPNILSNTDYTSAASIAGLANAGASYLDTKSLFETLYSLVGIGLPLMTSSLGGQMPIDPTLLPEPSVISSHLFGSATSINVQDSSIEFTSFGPIGDARLLYMAAAGGTALGVWYQQARATVQSQRPQAETEGEPTQEELTKSELATIGRGLFLYARSHDGAFPGDLKTLADAGTLKDESGDTTVNIDDYSYVPGLMLKDDSRLIIVFSHKSSPSGRGVLLVNMNVMDLTDSEISEQVGGWLDLSDNPPANEAEAACIKNLHYLGDSVKRYAELHDGLTPEKLDWKTSYRFAPLVLHCPADTSKGAVDYAAVAGLSISSIGDDKKADTVLVYEAEPRHDGKAAVAFLDGNIKLLTAEELKTALDKTKALAAPAAQ